MAFWNMVNTSNILNHYRLGHRLVTTAFRSDRLQPAPQALSPQHNERSATTAPFPFYVYFQHCERGGYITMTRSHEHQHSASSFNSPNTTAWKDFLSKLSGFLSHWFSLGDFGSQGV